MTIPEADVRGMASHLLGQQATSAQELKGGRNSRVYRVDLQNAEPVVLKLYTRPDRLQAEFSALQFLWDHGIRAIPRPLVAGRNVGCAVYQFVAGEHIQPKEIVAVDIDAAVCFLGSLHELSASSKSRALPPASEACFTIREVFSSIEQRLDRLAGLAESSGPSIQLHRFLSEDFRPELDAAKEWSREQAEMWWHTALPKEQQTLSPSDFGFHNVLRGRDGELVFLDLEHFGWDDPAKMAADFLLHPHEAMAFDSRLKERFLAGLIAQFDAGGMWLAERIRIVLPLFGLKWCTILLNEFVPADLARRRFAGRQDAAGEEQLLRQLHKAQGMLARARNARTLTPGVF